MESDNFNSLINYISNTFEEEDPEAKPETITLTIRLLNNLNSSFHTKEYALICGLVATFLENDYEGEFAFLFLPHYDKSLSTQDYINIKNKVIRDTFNKCYDVICELSGYLYDPENPHKTLLPCIGINKDSLIQIGKGTFGVVYKLGNTAIKSTSYLDLDTNLYNLVKELAVLNLLQECDNIPRLKFISMDNTNFYVGMTYLPKQLFSKIGKLNRQEKWLLCKDLTNALYCIHRKGIIHCDISINNTMLDENKKGYIIDFGSSLVVSDKPVTMSNYIGTHVFRDYVLLKDLASDKYESAFGYEIDIWSLGIVFYITVTEASPFPFGDEVNLYAEIIENNIDRVLMNINDDFFREIITRMLDLNPETRITSEQLLKYFD